MAERISCFVMSGGIGSRLWPLSREDFPKQFHGLVGGGSMMSRTIARMRARSAGQAPVYLLGSGKHSDLVASTLADQPLGDGVAIFEPVGRNTAAAVAIATLQTMHDFGDGLVLIAPSDHNISTDEDFWRTIEAGVEAAEAGRIVVFGIVPTYPETGFGYIETRAGDAEVKDVVRFVEKPDIETAKSYLETGAFLWNAGLFLFRASAMKAAFEQLQPEIWNRSNSAFEARRIDAHGVYLPLEHYQRIPSDSIDYAIMERLSDIGVVPARFRWSDLGSWQALYEAGSPDENGNVLVGDVAAVDCRNSYLRADGRLLTAAGIDGMTVVVTSDVAFVAPTRQSQIVKKVVERLDLDARSQTKVTPRQSSGPTQHIWRERSRRWLFDEAFPLWASRGVDDRYGGFHEALLLDGGSAGKAKRTRTMARQIYAFATASRMGWQGHASRLVDDGLSFLATKARTDRGGWARTLAVEGDVIDATEDAYDHSCVLLALAAAHASGNSGALELGKQTFAFIDEYLADPQHDGFLETPAGSQERRSNPHMHLLEAFIAWYDATGDRSYLDRAARIYELFRDRMFDQKSWSLGEYFDAAWAPMPGVRGDLVQPGHMFEWAALLLEFADRSGQNEARDYARKLYAAASALGVNRKTGLCFAEMTRDGRPCDVVARVWPQTEAVKAVTLLDAHGVLALAPEIEERVARLFIRHIDPAPRGLWIDGIDGEGKNIATEAPASILYHLVSALSYYISASKT